MFGMAWFSRESRKRYLGFRGKATRPSPATLVEEASMGLRNYVFAAACLTVCSTVAAADTLSADSIISAHERGISDETVIIMAAGARQHFSDADVVRMLRAGVEPSLISSVTGGEQPTAAQIAAAAAPAPVAEPPPAGALPDVDGMDPEEREFLLREAAARAAERDPGSPQPSAPPRPSLTLGPLEQLDGGTSRAFSGLGIQGQAQMVQVVENHLHVSALEKVVGPAYRFEIELQLRNVSASPIEVDVALTSTTAYVSKPKVHDVYTFIVVADGMAAARAREEAAAYERNFVVHVTTNTKGKVGPAGSSIAYSDSSTTTFEDRSPERERAYQRDLAAIEARYADVYQRLHDAVFEPREVAPGDAEVGTVFVAGPARAEAEYVLELRIGNTWTQVPMGRMPSS
jgi:hypothetical protein